MAIIERIRRAVDEVKVLTGRKRMTEANKADQRQFLRKMLADEKAALQKTLQQLDKDTYVAEELATAKEYILQNYELYAARMQDLVDKHEKLIAAFTQQLEDLENDVPRKKQ